VKLKKHPLQQIVEQLDYYKARSYSGRGRGTACLGVVIGQGDDALGFAAEVIALLSGADEHEEIAEAFRNSRTDALGKGMIVYFPDIEFVDPKDPQ
jgi:hypothetical protein